MLGFNLSKPKRRDADARALLRSARAHDRFLADLTRLRAAYDESKAILTRQALRGGGTDLSAAWDALDLCRRQIEESEAMLASSQAAIVESAFRYITRIGTGAAS